MHIVRDGVDVPLMAKAAKQEVLQESIGRRRHRYREMAIEEWRQPRWEEQRERSHRRIRVRAVRQPAIVRIEGERSHRIG